MKNFFKYLATFLAGVALAFALGFMMALKKINVTNADTVVENLQQSIKKLKQNGEGNSSDMSVDVSTNETGKTKKELRQEKRQQRKEARKSK